MSIRESGVVSLEHQSVVRATSAVSVQIGGVGIPMVVQIEPAGSMDRNPDQQQRCGAGESGEERSERGKSRCGHQGDPDAV